MRRFFAKRATAPASASTAPSAVCRWIRHGVNSCQFRQPNQKCVRESLRLRRPRLCADDGANAVLHLQIRNMNMKRSTLLLFAAALSAALIYPALARQGTKMAPDAKSTTIEGAVRDLACPVQNPAGSATSFSLKCTLDCVRHGSPIIILTKTGLIYFPISADMPDSSQREKMMPFVGKYVQATGAVFERNGTRAIAITQIKELKSVHIDTDAR
jgi:hypothetical protein